MASVHHISRNISVCIALCLTLGGMPNASHGQLASAREEVYTGGELEEYLRTLQVAGIARPFPWSLRGFGPAELDRILPADTVSHPWAERFALVADSAPPRSLEITPLRAVAGARFNTGFAYGSNDGPIWAGKGLTSSVQLGVAGRWGPLSVRLAPIAFRAENAEFELMNNGLPDDGRFRDAVFPNVIDRPQRFGDESYARIDPGESFARIDHFGATVGVSTASQTWGPGQRYPIILGPNAGGYPHFFLGTSTPVDLWLAHAHGRVVYGRLSQSDYSPIQSGEKRRFMSGFVLVVQPRGAPGLELTASRFFHTAWPADGIGSDELLKPFEGLLKRDLRPVDMATPGDSLTDASNQIASLSARWAFPEAGFELFFELAREDHSYDTRDLVQEPDHSLGRLIGFRKSWRRADGTLAVVRGESVNLQATNVTRYRSGQGSFYLHDPVSQGHTHRGQLLGANVGSGNGAGAVLGGDWYTPHGRWSVEWSRVLDKDPVEFWRTEDPAANFPEVQHALGVTGTRFVRSSDISWGVAYVWAMNRNLFEDQGNLNLTIMVQRPLR